MILLLPWQFECWSRTLNSETSYDIRLRDSRAVRGVLIVQLHHELRRVDLAVLLGNIRQVEFLQKALLHGSEEVLHPQVRIFLLQKVLLWQLRVKSLRVIVFDVIVERFTGAGATGNHQTQTHLQQKRPEAQHFETISSRSHWAGTNVTFFPAWKQTLLWQGFENGEPPCKDHCLMSAPMLPV